MSKPFALVIEDEPDLSRLFATIIQSVGFETEQILDGQVAVDRLPQLIPALVLLDLHLPQVSGQDILYQICHDERLTQTKVIVVSADTTMIGKLTLPVDFTLQKPISYTQLRNLVRSLYYKISNI